MKFIKLLGFSADADPDTVAFMSHFVKFPMYAEYSGKTKLTKSGPEKVYYAAIDDVTKVSIIIPSGFVFDFQEPPQHNLRVEESSAFWQKHHENNSWTLKAHKMCLYTGNVSIRTYGWIDEILCGKNKDKFVFTYPSYEDGDIEDEDSNVNICDTLAMAIFIVLKKNHPIMGAYI